MVRIIGDMTGKSALDEMEEISRQFNEECKEEERLERIEAERRAKGIGAPPAPVITPASGIGDITADDALIFEGNWAQCVSGCNSKSLEVAAARQIAELRIKHGGDSVYCTNGGWVAENFNYLPSGDILVASSEYNPNFKYAEAATKAHKAGNEFYLDDKIVAELLQGIKQGSVLLLKRKDVPDKIPADALGKEPLTAFLGWGKGYGEFLSKNGINAIRLFVDNKQKKAFSRALWAVDLYCNSALGGHNYLCNINGRVFGVRRGAKILTGNGGSQ